MASGVQGGESWEGGIRFNKRGLVRTVGRVGCCPTIYPRDSREEGRGGNGKRYRYLCRGHIIALERAEYGVHSHSGSNPYHPVYCVSYGTHSRCHTQGMGSSLLSLAVHTPIHVSHGPISSPSSFQNARGQKDRTSLTTSPPLPRPPIHHPATSTAQPRSHS